MAKALMNHHFETGNIESALCLLQMVKLGINGNTEQMERIDEYVKNGTFDIVLKGLEHEIKLKELMKP